MAETRRLKLACASDAEFLEKHAAVLGARGLFVPSAEPDPVGARCRLELSFRETGVRVFGDAVVARRTRMGSRSGVVVFFTQLDPESLQFPLLPVRIVSAPAPLATPKPNPVEEKTRVAAEPSLAELLFRDTPGEESTRVHRYSERELTASRDPDKWAGGLQPFDRVKNFQLLKRLGTGGMAEVFLARSVLGHGAEKLVALKMIFPEFGPGTPFAQLFLNEARVSASLQHANLVQVFDVGEAAGRGYLAMEYVHGRTLSAILQRLLQKGEPPPLGLAVAVGLELCHALAHLHGQRGLDGGLLHLVHRDVSPGNVLISGSGELKLVDFGVAAASAENVSDELVVGKRSYMAPEQATGRSPKPSWDLYALGVVLHELLTLDRLFDGDTPTDVSAFERRKVQLPPSTSNPNVPAALDRLVLWLTEADPARRPGTAVEVHTALRRAAATLPPFDLAGFVQQHFGAELAAERTELAGLVSRARAMSAPHREESSIARPLRQLSRRIQTTDVWRRIARHRRPVLGAVGVLLVTVAALTAVFTRSTLREEALTAAVARFDSKVEQLQLAGPGNDTALAALGELRGLAPDDPRVTSRAAQLEALFLRLATAAEGRGDLGEAATHYQGAFDATGGDEARAGLARVEQAVREGSRAEVPTP